MCGIVGIMALDREPIGPEKVGPMCAAVRHRGPDDAGYHIDSTVALGMRRLSIIDLDTGRQPIHNEDGSIWAVLNGEIYNYRALRRELMQRGHRFYTGSDTEPIVHLYEEHGPSFVRHLRGMFGLALWDAREERLLLARDRLGIKPLYYAIAGGRLLFASELKAIVQDPSVDRRLNWGALSHLFTFQTTPPSQSIIDGVLKLEPAQVLMTGPGRGIQLQHYWELKFEPDRSRDERYYVERLREMLRETVDLHMISDVPIGAFLSGGIDSSAVVATMASLSSAPLKTFSIGFRDHAYDELVFARQISRQFGTEHHELIVEPDAVSLLDELAWHLDEPFGDPSSIPTYIVSRLAAEHVKVALSGDGGDEMFAGYDKYLVEARERSMRFLTPLARRAMGLVAACLPAGMRGRNFLRHHSLDDGRRYLDAVTLFRREQMRRLFVPEVWELLSGHDPMRKEMERFQRPDGDWLSALQAADFQRYLPLDILTKVDRMSMAHGLEVRPPLLDHVFVEFAATIPSELRMRGVTTKYIFKQAMRGILPDEVIDRPKHGFGVPLGRWFRGQLGEFVERTLLSGSGERRGLFDPVSVRRLIAAHRRGRPMDLQLWMLLSFELWCRAFLDAPRGPSVAESASFERATVSGWAAARVVERGSS